MPEYLDEKIVAQRWAREKLKHRTLQDGMYVGDEFLEFVRIPLFQNAFAIVLPASFVDLPGEMKDRKYPYLKRPQIIKTSLDTRVNYCFSYFPQERLEQGQTLELAEQVRALAMRTNPSLQFMEVQSLENAAFPTSWYDFKSFALDGQLYNLVFLSSIQGRLMHGLFNCPFEDREGWKPVAFQMIEAIGECPSEDL